MPDQPAVAPGDRVEFRKTVGESDVYLFAGLTGDFSPNHIDAEFMRQTPYGQRIAHGVLVLGLTSTASTRFLQDLGVDGVSYGYDRVRFTHPVFIGDTVTVEYVCRDVDSERGRITADITVRNVEGTVCLVAQHILALT